MTNVAVFYNDSAPMNRIVNNEIFADTYTPFVEQYPWRKSGNI